MQSSIFDRQLSQTENEIEEWHGVQIVCEVTDRQVTVITILTVTFESLNDESFTFIIT